MDSSEQLKSLDLKVTRTRVCVLDYFKQHPNCHLNAEQLHRTLANQDQDIGVATVYRVLNQFEAKGLLKRHRFEGEHFVYELSHTEHHDHLVCQRCGEVKEFLDDLIETQQIKVAEQFGYTLATHDLNLYGLCPQCQHSK